MAMTAKNPEAFNTSLIQNEIPVDPSFANQLYSTIHYLYPTATKTVEAQPKQEEILKSSVYDDLKIPRSTISNKSERESKRKSRSRSNSYSRRSHSHSKSYSQKYHSRSRSRSNSHLHSHHHSHHSYSYRNRRSPSPSLSPRQLEVNGIYDGRVRSIMDYGVFIELCDVYPHKEGLCHISNISQEHIRHPSDVVHRDELVKVKIIQISGNKISLSMKDVNQLTGEPVSSLVMNSVYQEKNRSALPPVRRKRLSSHERFELEQLISSGVLSPEEKQKLLSQYDNVGMDEDVQPEEAVEIEVNDTPAPFIKDSSFKNISLEPTKIVKNPEGSLARAALTGSIMVNERKALRERQAKEERAKLPEVLIS